MVGRIRREGELERERASRECVSVWRKTGDRGEQILSLLQRCGKYNVPTAYPGNATYGNSAQAQQPPI